jgi:hypothetical protein
MITKKTTDLTPVLEGLRSITAEAQNEFGALSGAQLNWKPAPDSWSVAQCLDHLIKANVAFFPILERIAAGGRKHSVWESVSPFTGFIGRWMIKSLDPASQKKLPAPKGAKPSSSDVDADIVAQFAANQERAVELIANTEKVDLRRTIITSPFMRLMTYSLWDGYQIVIVHERRHLGQARRVTQAPGFPAA